jgi:hypothetical protein
MGAGSIDSLFCFWSSVFASENSLFEFVGNSFPSDWICTGISADPASAMPKTGEFPCSFPDKQGIAARDEFAPDYPHRHSVCPSGDFPIKARDDPKKHAIPRGFG